MNFSVDKPKTWKGFSYVLKSDFLKSELKSRLFDGNVLLNYWTPQGDNTSRFSLIEAEYWLPNHNVDHTRFYIRTGVVPSTQRKKFETIVKENVIPELIAWIFKVENEPQNLTLTDKARFTALYLDDELIIQK